MTIIPDTQDKDFNPLRFVHSLMTHEEMQVLNNATRPAAWTIKTIQKKPPEADEFMVLDNYDLLKSGLEKLQRGWHDGHIVLQPCSYAYALDPIIDVLVDGLTPVTKWRRGDRVFIVGLHLGTTNQAHVISHPDKIKEEVAYAVEARYLGTRRRHRLLEYIRNTLGILTDIDEQGNLNFNDFLAGTELRMKASTQVREVKVDE